MIIGSKFYFYDGGFDQESKVHSMNLEKAFETLACDLDGAVITQPSRNNSTCLDYLMQHKFIKGTRLKVVTDSNLDDISLLPSADVEKEMEICLSNVGYSTFSMHTKDVFFHENSLHFYYGKVHPLYLYHIKQTQNPGFKKAHCQHEDANYKNLCLQIRPSDITGCPTVFLTSGSSSEHVFDIVSGLHVSVMQVSHDYSECYLPKSLLACLPTDDELRSMAFLLALCNRQNSFVPVIEKLSSMHAVKKSAEAFKFYFWQKRSVIESCPKKLLLQPRKPNSVFKVCSDSNAQSDWYRKHKDLFPGEITKAVEKETEKQLKNLMYLKRCLKWAYFYHEVDADLYVASSRETNAFHDVLSGIIIASVWKKSNCRIALLSNAGLQISLDKVFPKELREIAGTTTEIWYLNDYPCDSLQQSLNGMPLTYFTVNPFFQSAADCKVYSNASILVDPSNHVVTAKGMKCLNLNDIKSVTEIERTAVSVSCYRHRASGNVRKTMESSRIRSSVVLDEYLRLLGYPNPNKLHQLSSVLECLLGVPIVSQLYCLQVSKDSRYLQVIPTLLSLHTKGNSLFQLNRTKTAATYADIEVHVPTGRNRIEIVAQVLHAAKVTIKDPKTPNIKVMFYLEFTNKTSKSFNVTKHLKLEGSYGQTVAECMISSLSNDEPSLLAKSVAKLKLGEILYILLGESGARHVINSLPHFLSEVLCSWKIKNYLTTINKDSNDCLEQAHIYADIPPEQTPLCIGQVNLTFETMVIHIYPSHKEDDRAIQIEGECRMNMKHLTKLSATLAPGVSKGVKLTFTESFTAEVVLGLLGIDVSFDSLCFPLKQIGFNSLGDGLRCETGCTLSQALPSSSEVELSSLFFTVQCLDISKFLPTSVCSSLGGQSGIKITAYTKVYGPLSTSPKVGLEAQFLLTHKPSTRAICLDCLFTILCPSVYEKQSYIYSLVIQPCYRPYMLQDYIQGASIYDIVSIFSTEIGRNMRSKLDTIPEIGCQILNSVILKKGNLQISDRIIQQVKLNAYIPRLELFSGKAVLHSGDIILFYSDEGLSLECSGKLTLLERFTYNIEMILPTNRTEGKISLENFNKELVLSALLEEFGWLSSTVKSFPIMSSMLNVSIRRLKIIFAPCSENAYMQVLEAEFTVHNKEFDIGILKLNEIELTVTVKLVENTHKIYFTVNCFIAESLHATLEYNPDDHMFNGCVCVSCFSKVMGLEALQAFHVDETDPSVDGFTHLSGELKDYFMDVLKSSDNQQSAGCGLTASITFTLRAPSRSHEEYSLEHICLELRDALKIRNCIVDTMQFEYSKSCYQEFPTSTVRLVAIIKTLETTESMTMRFDLTSKESGKTLVTAVIERGTQGMKLSSVLELCGCNRPNIPNVGLPSIFDLELVGGLISFTLAPFQVCSFSVDIIIPDWLVFDDPCLQVQNLKLHITWKAGSLPELTFTDSFLIFRTWKLLVSGRLSPKHLDIQCRNPSSNERGQVLQFESLLSDYSPSSISPCPTVPTDIALPSMVVKFIELDVHLEEMQKRFQLKSFIAPSSTWTIDFGDQQFSVTKIGGALEWTRKSNSTSTYRAILYGTLSFCSSDVYIEMSLGTCDSILLAVVSNLHYGQVADYLLYQEEVSPDESTLSQLVPPNVRKIAPVSAMMAINITRKQFIFSGVVEKLGQCLLFVDLRESQMNYVVALALEEGFRFSVLSESLAFIDEYITIHHVNVVVSSVELQQLSEIIEPFEHSCSQLNGKLQGPFSTLSGILTNDLVKKSVGCGTTLYAAIDCSACRHSNGAIKYVFELGDENLTNHDIIVKVFVPQVGSMTHTDTKLELCAYVSRIALLGMLEFSDVRLVYKLHSTQKKDKQSNHKLELSGIITLVVDLNASDRCISFDGKLCIADGIATFITTTKCRDVVHRPAGLNFTLRNLKLRLQIDLRKNNKHLTDICISGEVEVGTFLLEARFLLKSAVFQVFHVRLMNQLSFSCLLDSICNGWSASSLNVVIKEGQFYYARQNIEFTEDGKVSKYEAGYHIESVITFINSDFRIKADISCDRSELSISGRSVEKLILGLQN